MAHHDPRVIAVFESAILHEPTERAAFVRQTCADDADLRRQVESLLADAEHPIVIDQPVGEAIAALIADDDLPRMVGTQVGAFRVESLLGAGGMGAVYRATDTVLRRQVAIKVLPADLAADPARVLRFRREAEALAALNHPNIGAIYGLEPIDAGTSPVFALVLELVEGPTLAETLAAGALPVDDALAIAEQLAEALDAAHQQGIVHRDLKPGNLKVRDDGTVKVLDFGIAGVLPSERRDAGDDDAGTILGTPAYMSPEQAAGKPVTRTTDIWAFGCVLYEMLTGRAPFRADGETPSAPRVRGEPDYDRLPASTPHGIRTLLRHCLERDPRRRWPDAGSLRIAIEDARTAPADVLTPTAVQRTVSAQSRLMMAAAIVSIASLGALAAWRLARDEPSRDVARVLIGVSPATEIARTLDLPNARPFRAAIALSPDGRSLAFIGVPRSDGGRPRTGRLWQLYLRRIDRLEATPVAGTDGAQSPIFSPDGRWIGFWQAGGDPVGPAAVGVLRKVPLDGGPVVTICRAALPAGISWGPDGRIVFANHGGGGLWRVSNAGGTPEALTTPDRAQGELGHRLPQVLPDGRAVLFTIQRSPGGWDDTQVAVRSLLTGEQKRLVDNAADARYVPSGHLVYARAGTLFAQPFDLARLEVTGTPVGVVDDVMQDVNSRFTIGNSGAAQFSVSSNGSLAYLTGGVAPEGQYVPVWVDRTGAVTEVGIPARSAASRPRLSPDGRRIAFPLLEGIGIFDVARQSFQLLTSPAWGPRTLRGAPELRFVAWHPDGERITFTGTDGDLFWMPADGSGDAERLTPGDAGPRPSDRLQVPTSWAADGRTLIFTQRIRSAATLDRDVWTLTLGGFVPAARPFLANPADEPSAEISPNGRYLAYESNQSGRAEIYVQRFPAAGRRELVSTEGGSQPAWARNGRELFYRSWGPDRTMRMMVVDVGLDDVFTARAPRVLWEAPGTHYPGGTGGRTYDVAPDGRRFLMNQQRDPVPQPPIEHVVLVQNWLAELERTVPKP